MTALPPPHRDGPPADAGDARLRRAVSGDADALESLLRDIEPTLRSALSIAPRWNRALDVDDVLQVTYLEAFLRIESLTSTNRAGFAAWIRRIAENNLRDAIRALERGKRPDPGDRVTQGGGGESARTLLAAVAARGASPRTESGEREEIERLREAVARLPRRYRIVIEQLDLAERPVAAVAEQLRCSKGAVHMMRARAHDRLAELLR